jgi:hypothetical protein
MNKLKQFAAVLAVSMLFVSSTFADRRPRNESDAWRRSERRDDRRGDFVSGVVRRVDYRRDVIEIRDRRSGRQIVVDARRADRRSRRGIDVSDLRRGDYVELQGSWVRGGVFQAYRIDSVDSRR